MENSGRERREIISRGDCPAALHLAPGMSVQVMVSGALGAEGLTTCLATFEPGARLPYHTHPISEVITLLEGEAFAFVEGRRYPLRQYDALHVPAETAHAMHNPSGDKRTVLHTSFASAAPGREDVNREFPVIDREATDANCPESLVRFASAPVYELAPKAHFRDLFARRLGSRGVCGGYGIFEPGSSLPCHFHGYDESITIIQGKAVCQVAGAEYDVSNRDTVNVPQGRTHRFLNRSNEPMAMIWVYAGDEPDRTIVDAGFCDGSRSPATLPGNAR